MKTINYNVDGLALGARPPLDRYPTIKLDTLESTITATLAWFGTVCRATFRVPNEWPGPNGFTIRLDGRDLFRGVLRPEPDSFAEGDVLYDLGGCRAPEVPQDQSRIVYRPLPLTIRGIDFYRGESRWIAKHQDGFPWFYKFLRGENIRHLIEEAKSWPGGGANGARVFFAKASGPNYGTWAELIPGQYDYAAVREFLALMRSYEMTCEMTNGDYQVVCQGTQKQIAHLDALGNIAREFPDVALLEFANEWQKNGLERAAVHPIPGVLCCAGSSLSDGKCYTPPLQWSAAHARRSGFPEKSLDAANVTHHQNGWDDASGYKVGRQPVVVNEMIGAADADISGLRTTSAEFFFQMGRMLSAFNGGTFHSDAGLYGTLHSPTQARCAEAFFRGINRIE